MNEGTLRAVLIFPSPWPPAGEVSIFSGKYNNTNIRFKADKTGRLNLHLQSGTSNQRHQFQPIRIEGTGRAILWLEWSNETANLYINGLSIARDPHLTLPPQYIKTDNLPAPAKGLIYPQLDAASARSAIDKFFLQTVKDIDSKIYTGSEYELIRASGLLRQLLLDNPALLHEANKPYQLRFVFKIIDYKERMLTPADFYAIDLDPAFFPGAKSIDVKLDEFLAATCFKHQNLTATVRDVIKACANARGGIHLGKVGREAESLAIQWDEMFSHFEAEPSLRVIASISRVAIRAFRPLIESMTEYRQG